MINVNNPLFLIPAMIGSGVILTGFLKLYFPAKKINNYYGYRTKRSKRSVKYWTFAQKYHAIEMIWSGLFLSLLSVIGFFVEMQNKLLATLIGFCYAVLLVIAVIFKTEKAMIKKFDK